MSKQINAGNFDRELAEMDQSLSEIVRKYSEHSADYRLKGLYAQWHLKGLMFHAQRILSSYKAVHEHVYTRILSSPDTTQRPNVLIMYVPEMQEMMYEVYAFINLAKITLDHLQKILKPLFLEKTQLPKSISDFTPGVTTCPTYERIANTEEIRYLIDLRNCLAHYRTFAVSNNSLFVMEGVDINQLSVVDEWTKPMAKGVFRIAGENKIVVNVFLPDTIFNDGPNKTLSQFTYNKRINLLAETMRFLRHILFNYLEAFAMNIKPPSEKFQFVKKGVGENVEYKKIIL
jgi:hypothetical protein